MLPQINRLRKKKEIDDVFKKGKSQKKDFLVFKIANNNLKDWRFSIIVSKKVSKKAVVRNKIRRRLSGMIAEKLKNKKTEKPAKDVLIIVLPQIKDKGTNEIRETFSFLAGNIIK
ncbi:MAG: ribonuclease P protein component [Candidatus Nealsonbacteria bacterium]